jgi:hypothetical protein
MLMKEKPAPFPKARRAMRSRALRCLLAAAVLSLVIQACVSPESAVTPGSPTVASATPTTPDDSPPTSTTSAIPPQRCVGAVGSQCDWVQDGKGMVSVGSILHDNCCILNYPNGRNCNNGGHQDVCGDEWSLAVAYASLAYSSDESWRWEAAFAEDPDDIAFVDSTRSPSHRETVATTRLAAPAGIKLFKEDVAFCGSGRFVESPHVLAGQEFGTCAAAVCVSLDLTPEECANEGLHTYTWYVYYPPNGCWSGMSSYEVTTEVYYHVEREHSFSTQGLETDACTVYDRLAPLEGSVWRFIDEIMTYDKLSANEYSRFRYVDELERAHIQTVTFTSSGYSVVDRADGLDCWFETYVFSDE